jgi:hypothetical protein
MSRAVAARWGESDSANPHFSAVGITSHQQTHAPKRLALAVPEEVAGHGGGLHQIEQVALIPGEIGSGQGWHRLGRPADRTSHRDRLAHQEGRLHESVAVMVELARRDQCGRLAFHRRAEADRDLAGTDELAEIFREGLHPARVAGRGAGTVKGIEKKTGLVETAAITVPIEAEPPLFEE